MSWQIVKGLKESRAAKFAEATAIRDKAHTEKRDLTPEESTSHDAILTEVESFGARIAREERAMELNTMLGRPGREGIATSTDMPVRDLNKYSILRALDRRADGLALDGVEAEIHSELLSKRHGQSPQGMLVPWDMPMPMKQRTILDTTQGAGAVPTIVEPTFIEVLRNKTFVVGLGSTILPNMTGNFSLPKQTSEGNSYWVAEGSAPTGSFQTVGQVLFAPKTVGAYTDISRNFLRQSAFDAEMFVRNDLARILAIAIDTAVVNGSGTANQPLGLLNNTNTGTLTLSGGTSGSALTFKNLVSLETTVAAANADVGAMAYATNAKVRGALKGTARTDGSTNLVSLGFVWDDNQVNGYKAVASNIMPSTFGGASNLSSVIFGDWSSVLIAMWGGLDILLDPYTGGAAGNLRIIALQSMDIECRHPESFATCANVVA